jgi:hypothetical protein
VLVLGKVQCSCQGGEAAADDEDVGGMHLDVMIPSKFLE